MPKSGIYLTIMFLMVTNVVLGFVLMLLADYVWQNDALRLFGLGLAVVGGLGYLIFRLLGRGEVRRRIEQGEDRTRGWDDPGGEDR